MVVVLLLAACGGSSNEEDRRFANDPGEARPTATTAPTLPPEVTEEVPTASPETLLQSRGAPSTVYVLIDAEIVAIDSGTAGADAVSISPPADGEFVAIDSSLSGDRIAAAVAWENSIGLVIFDERGELLSDWADVLTVSATSADSTPNSAVANETEDVFVQWGAQGDEILVGDRSQLVTVSMDGEATTIDVPDADQALLFAQWSPRGDRIAILSEDGDAQRIALIDPDRGTSTDVIGGTPDMLIETLAWVPDGSGISYLSVANNGSQVVVWDTDTESTRIVATAGQAGPSARIRDYTIAPDGRSIAYVIVLPEGQEWGFHSLWVRSLRESLVHRLPVESTSDVNALWWTRGGLFWGQLDLTDPAAAVEVFVQASSDGAVATVLEVPLPDVGVAGDPVTPVASPAATPDATPVD